MRYQTFDSPWGGTNLIMQSKIIFGAHKHPHQIGFTTLSFWYGLGCSKCEQCNVGVKFIQLYYFNLIANKLL
jgi:hypothetical protein